MNSQANGSVELRKTHPALYRAVMVSALASVALSANFFFLTPTFEVWATDYTVWAIAFLVLGVAKGVYLNLHRDLRLARFFMASSIGFLVYFGIGTMQPWWEGEGSLQLPILYLAMALIELPLALEPFVNQTTARRRRSDVAGP